MITKYRKLRTRSLTPEYVEAGMSMLTLIGQLGQIKRSGNTTSGSVDVAETSFKGQFVSFGGGGWGVDLRRKEIRVETSHHTH